MFIGGLPLPVIQQFYSLLGEVAADRVYVCCSGSFRSERAIFQFNPAAEILSNDVSFYSCALGNYLAGRPFAFRFTGALDFLNGLLDADPDPAHQVAMVAFALELSEWAKGKPNPYKQRHFDHLIGHAADFLPRMRAKIVAAFGELKLTEFRARDWIKHMEEGIAEGATVVGFPPTYKCLSPDERILTADLRWVRAGDLKVGDRLLAPEEEPTSRCRRWTFSEVTHSRLVKAPRVRVWLEGGEAVICTPEHPWLAGAPSANGRGWRWRAANALRPGSMVCRPLIPWESLSSYDAGWLAGLFDGEGSFTLGSAPKFVLVQKSGAVLKRAVEVIGALGFSCSVTGRPNGVQVCQISGGFGEALRAAGSLRPVRLLEKFASLNPSDVSIRCNGSDAAVRVDSVEERPPGPIQEISTTSRTYVGEGFLMHNSGYENMYRWLDQHVAWERPSFDTFDPADLPALVHRVHRSGVPYCFFADTPIEGLEARALYQAPGKRPCLLYASAGEAHVRRSSSLGTPFHYKPLELDKVTRASVVRVERADGPRAMYVRTIHLKKSITPVAGRCNFFLFIDDMLAGVLVYSPSKWGRGEKHPVYLLSDLATSREHRLSKLVARMALNKVVLSAVEAVLLEPIDYVETTAFSDHPVSMKYRGVFDLVSRKEAVPPLQGWQLHYGHAVIDETPQQAFDWWWSTHGDLEPKPQRGRGRGRQLAAARN